MTSNFISVKDPLPPLIRNSTPTSEAAGTERDPSDLEIVQDHDTQERDNMLLQRKGGRAGCMKIPRYILAFKYLDLIFHNFQ